MDSKRFILFIGLISTFFASYPQVLPAGRGADWSRAGNNEVLPIYSTVIDITDWGALGDGITVNDSAFTKALVTLDTNPTIIYFPAGIYLFTQPLLLKEDLIIRGASADSTILRFDLPMEMDLLIAEGSSTTDTALVLSPLRKDSSQFKVAQTTNFSIGDFIEIYENDSSLVVSDWAMKTTGQICRISDLTDTTIVLATPLRRNYKASRNPTIVKLNMISNIGIEELKIERLDISVDHTCNILFYYANNCWVKCIESVKCNFGHVSIRKSSNIEVRGNYFHDAFSYGDGGKAYGVIVQYASGECLISNNIFRHLRHAMLLQAGANGNVIAYNYSIEPYWTGTIFPENAAGDLVLHGNYPYANLFEGNIVQNIVIDDSHGSNGKYNTFFRNRAELYGFFMNNMPPSDTQNIIGNEITKSSLGFYNIQGAGHFEYGNNYLGTIVPSGTSNLPDSTYYMDTIPSYYLNKSSWPPIGTPNSLKQYVIEAKTRYGEGRFTLCSPIDTGVPPYVDQEHLQTITLFPNPAQDHIFVDVRWEGGSRIEGIEIIDLYGNISNVSDVSRAVDISHFRPGIYFVKIQFSQGLFQIKKLIILKPT